MFAQKILERVTDYHHRNRMKAEAAIEISHLIKSAYEEVTKEEEAKTELVDESGVVAQETTVVAETSTEEDEI